MSGKFIVNAVAVVGWLIASLVVFAIVVLFGFMGVGFMGLLILFIATQFELDSDRDEKARYVRSVRFFKYFGSGLALIGFGGFVYYQI